MSGGFVGHKMLLREECCACVDLKHTTNELDVKKAICGVSKQHRYGNVVESLSKPASTRNNVSLEKRREHYYFPKEIPKSRYSAVHL